MSATGHANSTARNTNGPARSANRARAPRLMRCSPQHELVPPPDAGRRGCAPNAKGSTTIGVGGLRREPLEHLGQRRAVDDREHVHVSGTSAWTASRQQEVDEARAAASGCSAPASTPAYSTWRTHVASMHPGGRLVDGRVGEDDLDRRARRVGHHERAVALARRRRRRTGRSTRRSSRRPRRRRWPAGRSSSPPTRRRRTRRRWRRGRPARATRSPGPRPRAGRGRRGRRGRRASSGTGGAPGASKKARS